MSGATRGTAGTRAPEAKPVVEVKPVEQVESVEPVAAAPGVAAIEPPAGAPERPVVTAQKQVRGADAGGEAAG